MSVNDQQLTEWFDGKTTVPGQVGVYRRLIYRWPNGKEDWRYSHWDGIFWGQMAKTADAARYYNGGSSYQNLDWRGLLEEHK